jgi:hypothetical protein
MTTFVRQSFIHHWDESRTCGKRHRWGGELLHTFVHTGHVVTVRTCLLCGATIIRKTGVMGRIPRRRR